MVCSANNRTVLFRSFPAVSGLPVQKKMAITLGKLNFAVIFVSLLAWDYVTQAQKASKDIPSLKLSKFAGPTLTFLFW